MFTSDWEPEETAAALAACMAVQNSFEPLRPMVDEVLGHFASGLLTTEDASLLYAIVAMSASLLKERALDDRGMRAACLLALDKLNAGIREQLS